MPSGRQPRASFTKRQDPDAPLLVLLHADGQDERSMLRFGRLLWAGAPMLRLRGSVPDGAGRRFLSCPLSGPCEWERERTFIAPIAEAIDDALQRHESTLVETVLIGLGGGADAAIGVLCAHPDRITIALLFHPRRQWDTCPPHLSRDGGGAEVMLILAPDTAHFAETARTTLRSCGADVRVHQCDLASEAELGRRWLQKQLRGIDG